MKPYYEHANLTLGYAVIIKAAKNHLRYTYPQPPTNPNFTLSVCIRPTFSEKVPQEWRELITKCWDPNPDVRPECAEVLARVQELEKQYKEKKLPEWDGLRTIPSNQSNSNPKRGYLLRTESRRVPLAREDADDLKGFAHIRLS